MGQCRAHYYFRHADPVDAKFFGEVVTLPTLNPKRIKHVLTQEQQYQDGNDLVVLDDFADNWSASETHGTATALATSDTTTDTAGTSQAIRKVLGPATAAARQEVNAHTNSLAHATGTTQTETSSQSQTAGRGGSHTRRQTLVPRLKSRTVITGVQFFPIEEQKIEGAVELSGLPVGTALEYIAGKRARRVRFPLSRNPLARTPKYARKKRAEFERLLAARPEYAAPAEIMAARQDFQQRLVAHLRSITVEQPSPPEPRKLSEPDESSPLCHLATMPTKHFIPTQRDVALLTEVGEMGLMAAPMLVTRHFQGFADEASALRSFRRRVKLYIEHDLLRVERIPVSRPNGGTLLAVHRLTPLGADLVAEVTGTRPRRAGISPALNPVMLPHRLGIVNTRLVFDDAHQHLGLPCPHWLFEYDLQPEAEPTASNDTKFILYESFRQEGHRIVCWPDAAARMALVPGFAHELLAYIEYDRSTETIKQFAAKVAGYRMLVAEQRYRQHWTALEPGHIVRVLVVVRSCERLRNAVRAISDHARRRGVSLRDLR